MIVLGLIVAVPIWLIFDTGFFTVLVVSVVLGLLHSLLKGKEYREAARQRQRQAFLNAPEHERLKQDQEESSYKPGRQDGGDEGRTIPAHPKELRAMPYKEYLQTPHWKRKREKKLRVVGRRCQLCNRGEGIFDVHHSTYDRLGEELDADLIVLCRECHSWHHENRRFGR